MRKLIVLLLVMLVALPSFAQEVVTIGGADCDVHGSARVGSKEYVLNVYKNRYTFPAASDFDKKINLGDLAKSDDPNEFNPDKAVVVTGYVYDVKVGGVETCNCKTKEAAFRDTHIELTVAENKTGPEHRVIAEVTPRIRAIMEDKGLDWSTKALKKSIKGHWVKIAGWLMYDGEHELEAFANDPSNGIGSKNWRATCWEIHPVTYMEILSSKDDVNNTNIPQESNSVQSPPKRTSTPYALILVIAVVVFIAVYLYFKK